MNSELFGAALVVLSLSIFLGIQNGCTKCEKDQLSETNRVTLVVIGVQQGSGGWHSIDPETSVKILEGGEIVQLRGIFGKEGDTIKTNGPFLARHVAWPSHYPIACE